VPVHCIIPARLASTRFPRKPLVKILGREMILRTLDRARLASCFDRIICATDSSEIASLVSDSGYETILTGECLTGSDRVAEAAHKLNLGLVVNLQGDEPAADLDLLRDVSKTLEQYPDSWVTGASPLSLNQIREKSIVKVKAENGEAVDFRREIPVEDISGWYVHRGIYAYSLESLNEFHAALPAARETAESLEPLRILGKRRVRLVFNSAPSLSVDLPSDVEKVEKYLNDHKNLSSTGNP
jgi:3-deoxy-manno-octulosonate cytidylyltransferase (CMP-KDO synthetase)